jgi:hypothetical protein
LLALGEVVSSTGTGNRPLEVVDEDFLEAFPGVDGVVAEALQPCEWCRFQSHREVDGFGGVGTSRDFNGSGVATKPLLRGLLAIILGDADRLEALRILIAVETRSECRKTITAVSILLLGYFTLPVPGVDDGSDVTSVIEFLAEIWMVGLSRVAPWRWLLPPASGLTPASNVIVVALLGSRTASHRSTRSLAAALAYMFVSDVCRRVLLIQLNPHPLRIAKCLAHVWVVATLEDGSHPSDVGHGSPEAPLARGREFSVQIALHRSHALIDPPSADNTSSVPGPPRVTLGIVPVAGVGCVLIFRYSVECSDGYEGIVFSLFCHQHLA